MIFQIMPSAGWPIRAWKEVFRSMATVAFPGTLHSTSTQRKPKELPSFSPRNPTPTVAQLTIHRITKTHHGRTLLTLGHAAEYLANSLQVTAPGWDDAASVEAIHILMGLSRRVFEEFAEQASQKRRVGDWVIDRVVRLIESSL